MLAPNLASLRSRIKQQSLTNVFIGIDFGTSYTKVSYSYAPTQNLQIETIKWGNDYFKQTVLYIQNERLYFEKPDGISKEIKYFKYSIVESKLKNNSYATVNNFEEMCCVYFLAQVIKRTLSKVQENLHVQNINDVKISINMGCPLENFYEEKNKKNKGLYQDILENAIVLAGGSRVKVKLPTNQVLISSLDTVYCEILQKKAILRWTSNVYPELAAEILLYHQSKFVADGVYAIIDIGGGTVDMALFQKSTNNLNKNSYMNCLAQKVLPYGIEILKSNRDLISDEQFKMEFASMLMNSKGYFDVDYSKYNKIDVFFLGGGANDDWYIKNIKGTLFRLEKGGIPELKFSLSIENFILSEEMLLQKNQRLIISQMLARHNDDITRVSGFPNFYEKENETREKENFFDMDEYLRKNYDKYRD